MKNVPDTPLGRMYRKHIELFQQKDIEGLLEQYTEDALLISSFEKKPRYFKGREALREHMRGHMTFQSLEDEIVFWAETDDPQTLMMTEKVTMTLENGEKAHMRFAGGWVLRDGKIAIHFAGMVQYPDGSLA